jgi:hypothetical protein
MKCLNVQCLVAVSVFLVVHASIALHGGEQSNFTEGAGTQMTVTKLDPAAPLLFDIDLHPGKNGVIMMPNVAEIWVQGRMNDANAVVTTTVNDSAPIRMNARDDKAFGYLIPLDPGTNSLVITATNTAGKHNDYRFTVVRSRDYRGAITSPEFGSFAEGQPQIVKGYVSEKIDEGTATEGHVLSVFVNGVPTVLGPVDRDGNISYETVRPVPLNPNGGPTAYSVQVHWSNDKVKQ